MPAITAEVLRGRFTKQINSTSTLIKEALLAQRKGHLSKRSADVVCESAMVTAYGKFETFTEELFYAVLLGVSGLPEMGGVVAVPSRRLAENIVQGPRDYLEWLPLKKTIERSDLFLVQGRPFSRLKLRDDDLAVLDHIRIVRNGTSHDSESSRRQVRDLAAKYELPGRSQTSADILRSERQGVARHQQYLAAFASMAEALTAKTDADAEGFLLDAPPIQKKQVAPPGRYVCNTCQKAKVIKVAKSLGECPVCVRAERKAKSWSLQFS